MLTETDSKTLAYVNLFAVLGTLENLCELVPEVRELLKGKGPISVGFAVKDGPCATLDFNDGGCRIMEGCEGCTIKLPFSSCEKFNGLIEGTVTPIPSKGFTKISFLTKTFVPLTELLTKYLKPSKEALENEAFREINTKLTLYTAAAAIAQVGNTDKSGRFSAGLMPDGDIAIEIKDVMGVTVNVKDHHLTTIKKPCEKPRAVLAFSNLEITRQLLNGEVSSMACICNGSVAMRGMLNMIDNMNRILDRVGQYLS
ncbi:MAG TPA: hypothetical protein VN381_03995 [Anaerovoracaceae bacterium]|nr:hypothetical protein [Anaerovoracaceae bacterium]